MKKSEMKPLDFSPLKKFTFIGGAGDYSQGEVCAMTALYLVTQIAAGKTTLKEAIATDEYGDSRFSPSTRVECVSETLIELVIVRNDTTPDLAVRKRWAMALLPRLVGTNLGARFDEKLEKIREQAVIEMRYERIDGILDEYKKTRDLSLLYGVENEAHRELEELDTEDQLPVLDKIIERMLAAVEVEKQRRQSRRKRIAL